MNLIVRKSVFALTVIAAGIMAISFTPSDSGYKVGDTVKDFKLKNIDGEFISLSGLSDNKGAIVIFTCNNCPFSLAYEDRIIDLHTNFADKGFPVVAINPNDPGRAPGDSFENMVIRAEEKSFEFPYLQDATQNTARAFGAARTPHVFLLTKEGKKYTVAYIGAIDNNTDEPEAATQKYVESAIGEILSGKPVSTNFTKAIGCTVKWKKS